jgi:hypothetical protein
MTNFVFVNHCCLISIINDLEINPGKDSPPPAGAGTRSVTALQQDVTVEKTANLPSRKTMQSIYR